MRILAVDSSGLVASVAIVEDDNLIAEYTVNYKKTHSQTLLPMLDEIVKMTEADLNGVDAIAVAKGPGSFTGLRIGAATVKGLSFALDKPVIGVPTVEGLAMNLYDSAALICPIMDARRSQVYTGLYRFQNHTLQVVKDQLPIAVDELIDTLNLLGEEVVFLGDGVPVYESVIKERIKVPYSFAPAHVNKQRASAIAVRAMEYYKSGVYENGDDFAPEYLRVSQAERERAAREQSDTSAE
ncbi:MAG: tRNA (adenosine(37)-N6)-threonylcarbamoyltransferase complex dimerization subunit type 1 TsaB [Lachnospiraceae bacterium]|nr:tRNA (adenosine(37)-N6)-threonylcarbamoyltransferase complex dimerization subunit type 1 TsaB [Lachnospiraceae bacterium]